MVKLNFKNGLIPVATQDYETGEVLMIAFMNEDAFEMTQTTGYVHYWSRTNRRVWKKGETSGHVQEVRSICLDCDGDTLLLKVDQSVAACHTGYWSCFYREWEGGWREIGEKVFDEKSVYSDKG